MHDHFYLSRLPSQWQSRVSQQPSQLQVWTDRWGWSPLSYWQARPNVPTLCHWWCQCDPARKQTPRGGWYHPPCSISLLMERPWRSSCGASPNTCANKRGYSVGWKAWGKCVYIITLSFGSLLYKNINYSCFQELRALKMACTRCFCSCILQHETVGSS